MTSPTRREGSLRPDGRPTGPYHRVDRVPGTGYRPVGALGALDLPPRQVPGDRPGGVEQRGVLRATRTIADVRDVVADHQQDAARRDRRGRTAQPGLPVAGRQV